MKELLANALIKILTKKTLKEVTVKEICEQADISKMTFYRSFKDKYDCLDYAIEHLFIERGALRTGNMTKEILNWMTTVEENRSFFRHIMESSDKNHETFTEECAAYLQMELERMVLRKAENKTSLSGRQKSLIRYNSVGMTEIVNDWVRSDCLVPAQTIARTIISCMSEELKKELGM